MLKTIIQHVKNIQHAISNLNGYAAFAFALACTERQWPVFQRASEGQPWVVKGQSCLRQGVDAAWQQLISGTPFSHGLSGGCASEVPRPEDIVDASSAAAHTIANSIIDLLDAIESGDTFYAQHLTGRNLGLLEMLLDEFKEHDLDDTPAQELVEQEIRHQIRDLEVLAKDSFSVTIEKVQKGSAGKCLFGHIWFPGDSSRATFAGAN